MTDYQAANLIGLLLRTPWHDNGDWFCELTSKCWHVINDAGLPTIENNFGDCIAVDRFWDVWGANRDARLKRLNEFREIPDLFCPAEPIKG